MKNHEKSQLTDAQLQAINLLTMGVSITDTANACGVTRETVSRWKNGNADFIAAYNTARLALQEETAQSIRNLKKSAVNLLEAVLGEMTHKVETGEKVDMLKVSKIASEIIKATDNPLPNLLTDSRDIQRELDNFESQAGSAYEPHTFSFDAPVIDFKNIG